jgi:hypothetical protein
MARLPGKGWAKQSDDPVLQEIYRALAYHENTPPGSLIEFTCVRCANLGIDKTFVGTSPRLLSSDIYDHIRRAHPEAFRQPIPR